MGLLRFEDVPLAAALTLLAAELGSDVTWSVEGKTVLLRLR